MAKKKKLFEKVQEIAPQSKQEAQKIVKRAESGGSFASKARSKADTTRDKNAAALRSEIKRASNLLKVNNSGLRSSETGMSKNRAEVLSRNISQGLYRGRSLTGSPQLQDSAVAQRTKNNEQYAKLVDAGLWKNGIYGTTLRPVNDEEMGYRQKYGYGKQYAEHINELSAPGKEFEYTKQVRDRNGRLVGTEQGKSAGLETGRAFLGLEESLMPRSYEKVLEKQYGYTDPSKSGLNVKQLEEARGSKSYMAGNLAGQTAQFVAAAPLAAPLEAAALTRAGIGAAKAGKAIRGVNTIRDAFRVAAIRNGVQSAVAVPINLMDALKEDNTADILKRFALNEAFDIGLGGLFEVPMLRRNVHFVKAVDFNNAANAARNTTEAISLRRQAIDELKKLDEKTIDAVRSMLDNRGTRNAIERSVNQASGRAIVREASEEMPERVVREAAEENAERTAREVSEETPDGATREALDRVEAEPAERVAMETASVEPEPRVEPEVRAEEPAPKEPIATPAEETANWEDVESFIEPPETPRRGGNVASAEEALQRWASKQAPEEPARGTPEIADIVPDELREEAEAYAERAERTEAAKEAAREQFGEYKSNQTPKGVEIDGDEMRVTKTYDTIKQNLSPGLVDEIEAQTFLKGRGAAFDKKTTDELIEEAARELDANPEAYTMRLLQDPRESKLKPNQRLVGLDAAQTYWREAGDIEMEGIVTHEYFQLEHDAGQLLRVHGILNRATPAARLRALDRDMDFILAGREKQLKKLGIDPDSIVVSEEARNAIADATTPEETAEAWLKASIEFWDQIPPTLSEKLDFFRMNAMLLNPKTHARNIIGNTMFMPVREVKNLVGTGIEAGFEKVGLLDKSARTKALLVGKDVLDNIKYAGEIFEKDFQPLLGATDKLGGARGLATTRPLEGKLLTAGPQGKKNPLVRGVNRFLDGVGHGGTWLLNKEDMLAMKPAFQAQMARIMKARGITAEELAANKALRTQVTEDSAYEALRAAYRDESWLATTLRKVQTPHENTPVGAKIASAGIKANFPFLKTPINIARRAADYSPLGTYKTVENFINYAKTGNQKALTTAIDRLSATMTGTGILGVGYLAAKNGHLTARLGDDRKGKYEADMGKQNFSLIIGNEDNGQTITLDWAAPAAIPFFTGVSMWEHMQNDGLSLWEIGDAIGAAFEPMTELSMLQSVDELLESYKRGAETGGLAGGITQLGIQSGLNYVGQFRPSTLNSVARVIDPVRRDIVSTAESPTQRTLERWVNRQKAGTPWASKTLQPYIDVRGDEQRNGSPLEQLLSPAYRKKLNYTKVDKELESVVEATGDEDVYPAKYGKYTVRYDGEDRRMTPEDRTNFLRTQGKTTYRELEELFDSGAYKAASQTERAEMIKKVYRKANTEGKRDMLIKAGENPWDVIVDDYRGNRKPDYASAKEAGLDYKTYAKYMESKEWDTDANGRAKTSEITAWLDGQELTAAQKAEIFDRVAPWNAHNPYASGRTKAGYTGSSGRGRGGRRRSGRGGSKAKRTASSKSYSATHTASDLRSNIKPVKISASSMKGLSKSQRKALLKMINKRLEA